MSETVAILGASANTSRFSYKAQIALIENGHIAVPINPKYSQIDGVQCYPNLKSFQSNIDTVTIYVNPGILMRMAEEIIHIRPKRVIFNPGAESKEVFAKFASAGIKVQNACTLVLLNTSSFTE